MVDVATLALELNTTGLERGADRSATITDRVRAQFDALAAKAEAVGNSITKALSFRAGNISGLDKAQAQFQQHNARLEQIAAASAGRIAEIEAKKQAALDIAREKFAQREIERQRKLEAQASRRSSGGLSGGILRNSSLIRESGESIQASGAALTALSASFLAVGAAAVKSALDIDQNINVLKALTGSAATAETRFKELTAISAKTPGLTTGFAVQLDSQLRVIGVTEQAINKLLPAIGKLNAVSKIEDPRRFVQNLGQLATTGFQVRDLRELINASPISSQLIKKTFNVDNALDGEKIRSQAEKLGLNSADAFFTAFAKAAAENQALNSITESFGARLEKLRDRAEIALRPLGVAILDSLGPAVEKGVAIIEKLSGAFAGLPDGLKTAITAFGLLAVALGPVVVGVGAFIQAFGALGNLASVAKSLAAINTALATTAAAEGVAAEGAVAAGAATATAFAPVLPILLAIGAAIAVVGIAWASYESATDKAAKITIEQINAAAASRDEFGKLSTQVAATADVHEKLGLALSKLPSSSQAVAAALQLEGEKVAYVTSELERQQEVRNATLIAQRATVTEALAEQQKEIEAIRAKRAAQEELARVTAQQAQSGNSLLLPTFGTASQPLERATTRLAELGAAIEKANQKERDALKTREETAAKLDVLQKALGGNTQSLIEFAAKSGASAKEVDFLRSALEEHEKKQRDSRAATLDTNDALAAQGAAAQQAAKDIADAFANVDLAGLQKGIKGQVDQITKEVIQNGGGVKDAAKLLRERRSQPVAGASVGQIITLDDLAKRERDAKAVEQFLTDQLTPKVRRGGGRRAESDARQLRAAEEALEQARAKAAFDIQEKLTKNIIELDKDAFEKRLIAADDYYSRITKRELELQDIEKRRIEAEIGVSEARRVQAKKGSPEDLREQAQQVELRKQLRILELERPNILRKINDELDKTNKLEKERREEILKNSINSSPGFQALNRFNADFEAQRKITRDAPQSQLRSEELRLQGAANAGLIREEQLTDALTLTRRKYRDAIIESLEAKIREAQLDDKNSGRFAEIERLQEEIDSVRNLGTELTRAERLQKRFAEQGVVDYSRLNDKLADLLASQKGLTEIFQDFRANTAQDLFNGIDSGIDALTRKFGVLGTAVSTLLKDLAKLAVSKILEKLLGINGGSNQAAPGFAIPGLGGQQRQSFNPLSLFTGGGGNASPASQFITPGFNPGAQSPASIVAGGGGNGGGGIINQVLNPSGGNQGRPSFLRSILGKIPGLNKLFGGGGGSPLTGPGSATGAGAFGNLDANGIPAGLGRGGANASTGLLGSFSGLAAGGLLAGGGILGSLAGGKSQFGRLLGGVGGTLLGGALGASGLLGGGIAGALPALFSNPITAIVGGALIGGALLFNFFAGREQRKFRKEVENEYHLKVDGKAQGTALYQGIKALGEEQFGKGKFGKHIVDTIRLEKAKAQLAAYGEATGQENNPLVRQYRDIRELTDANDPRNTYAKRAYGGSVRPFESYIVGDGGRSEVFTPKVPGQIFPSIGDFLRDALQSQMRLQLHGFGGASVASSGGNSVDNKMLVGVLARVSQSLDQFESKPEGVIVKAGLKANPEAAAEAVHTSIQRSSAAGTAIKNEVYKGR